MEIGQADLVYLDNALKTFKKGTFALEGMEVMAFAETVVWLNRVKQQIQHEIQMQEWQAQQAKQKAEQEAAIAIATIPKPEPFALQEAQVEVPATQKPSRKKSK